MALVGDKCHDGEKKVAEEHVGELLGKSGFLEKVTCKWR